MVVNITSGECLKEILEKKYGDAFVPFNEAMTKGEYHHRLFSDEFITERAITHQVSKEEYLLKLSPFIKLLLNVKQYTQINLYFGDDDFCIKNRAIVIQALKEYGYEGSIISNIVDELNGNVKSSENIALG